MNRGPARPAAAGEAAPAGQLQHVVTLLQSVTASSLDAVIAADLHQRVVWANPAVEALLGWAPHDLLGRPVTDAVPERSHAQFEQLWTTLTREARPVSVRTTRLRSDGAEVPVTLTANPLHDIDGGVIGVAAVLRDVHENLEVRRSLQAAVGNARTRFHQASVPQAVVGLDGAVKLANPALCELLGRPAADLLGRPGTQLVHEQDTGACLRRFVELRRRGSGTRTFECLLAHADGEPRAVIVDATVIKGPHGAPAEVAFAMRDMTELRRAVAAMERQTAFWRSMNQRSSELAAVTDAAGRLLYVSPTAARAFGYDAEATQSLVGYDFVHPDDLGEVHAAVTEVLAEPGAVAQFRFRLRHGDGSWRWVSETLTNALEDPVVRGLVVNLRDVTAEVEAERNRRESEARFRAIAEAAQEGILALDPEGRTLFANARTAEILGCRVEQLYDNDVTAYLRPQDAEAVRRRARTRHEIGAETYELPYRRPDGARRTLQISASPLVVDATYIGSVGMISDITDRITAERNLRRLAMQDPLTDLPNRRLHVHRLEEALLAQSEAGAPLTVMLLDLDQLKITNDTRGRHFGDRVIKAVADALRDAVRPEHMLARIGSDEFAIVCPGISAQEAVPAARELQSSLEGLTVLDAPYRTSVTIGVADTPPYDAEELQRRADAAMGAAKRQGRGRVAVFDARLAAETRRHSELAVIGRAPIDRTALQLGFQPILDLTERNVVGVETLLRWNDPRLGPVRPDELVAAFSAAGRAVELDRAVLTSAFQAIGPVVERGDLPPDVSVSVNVSALTVEDLETLARAVLDPIGETGADPTRLIVEVTEGAVMRDPAAAAEALSRLTESGVRVAVDDFGTGYSSLARLHRLPLHLLKIDRTFVQAAPTDEGAREIMRSIVLLAKTFGLRTIAEGVETEEQADLVTQLGCDMAQGFLWSPSVSVSQLATVIEQLRGR